MMQQETKILIRPAARGGKYLGEDAANAANVSALIALLDPADDTVVAYAFAETPSKQSSGPLALMGCMRRSDPFASDSESVAVTLSVKIDVPTVYRVVVYGPLSCPDQARLAQADITLLPGVDIGISEQYPEGVVVEVPGLCISGVSAQLAGSELSCTAKVTMMCGCEIHEAEADPFWPWPDTDFTIQLVTRTDKGVVYTYPMQYDTAAGMVSTFTGKWPSKAKAGDEIAEAWVYASEPKLGNQGMYPILPASQPKQSLPAAIQQLFMLIS